MTHPDHRHIPFPLDAITGITAARRHGDLCWHLAHGMGRVRAIGRASGMQQPRCLDARECDIEPAARIGRGQCGVAALMESASSCSRRVLGGRVGAASEHRALASAGWRETENGGWRRSLSPPRASGAAPKPKAGSLPQLPQGRGASCGGTAVGCLDGDALGEPPC